MKYHPFINGLRALAVVPVIFFHYRPEVFPGGYAGVDVFFVLSGFLITGVLHDMLAAGKFSLLTFYERRARRILPALFFTCILCYALAWLWFMPEDFALFGHSVLGVALFASNITFFEDVGYFAAPAMVKPLLHTWSLAVEEQFYLFYPLVLAGLYKFTRGDRRKLILGIGALFAVSLAFSAALTARQPEASFYFLHTRAWELLTGALVFLGLRDLALPRAAAEAAGLAGVGLLGFSYLHFTAATPFPGTAALAPCLGTALLLVANLKQETLTGRLLALRPLVATGLVSYGLYLYHWPLLVFARYVLERNLDWPETAGAIALTVALAALSYRFIETPVRSGAAFVPRKQALAAALFTLVLTAALGVAGNATNGFPGRFDAGVTQYLTEIEKPPQDCQKARKRGEERQEWCRIGDLSRDTPDFVIWGDSHASRAAHGLNVIAKEQGRMGWKISSHGCPPLMGLERIGYAKYQCPGANDNAMQFIRDHHIKTVILAARWDMLQQPEKGGSEDTQDSRDSRVRYTPPGGAPLYGMAAFDAALLDTVAQLHKLGARIFILKQVPSHLHYLSGALAKYAYFGRDPVALDRPIEEVRARHAPEDAAFAALNDSGVALIDPVPVFCPDGKRCLASANHRSLYHDNTHMTIYGSVWAKRMWQPVFDGK